MKRVGVCFCKWDFHCVNNLINRSLVGFLGRKGTMAKKSLVAKQQRKQKFQVREYSRCRLCGRPRAFLRKFGMCRICFRERALLGEVPGVTKSSW